MGRFNLLKEPWIRVMTDEKGSTRDISIQELFSTASEIKHLAGDMEVQDFAVMRFLLAILHTVFSRFDAEGVPYRFVELDERYGQLSDVSERYVEDYENALFDTWIDLWSKGKFPPILQEYLEKWLDRFYLIDEEFPFFQVTKEVVAPENLNKSCPSLIAGKNINRLISESGNKAALFSPKYSKGDNKELLSSAQLARWLIMFHGYTGLSDKVIFGEEKYKASKGWLFDIGGVSVRGATLFETLMLNCMLVHTESKFNRYRQRPCWETHGQEVIDRLFSGEEIDNLAELYTNWSRAVYIDPATDIEKPVEIGIVKVPEIQHKDQFLESMTLWRFNDAGENKNSHTPRKHRVDRSIWRSFGLMALPNSSILKAEHRKPGIIQWLSDIREYTGSTSLTIQAISMQDDGNATSWVPVDEITDTLNINNYVLTDVLESGWVPRINEAVDLTKKVVDRTYYTFITDMKEIRNLSSSEFVTNKVEDLYFILDQPFREWLADLSPEDEKDGKISCWTATLKDIVLKEAEVILAGAGPRDFTGIVKDGNIMNIATSYNKFKFLLNRQI